MEFFGVLFWIIVVLGIWGYSRWLKWGIAPRRMETRLPQDTLRQIFQTEVAVLGWKTVNDDDPMVAQAQWSGIIGQQISLDFDQYDRAEEGTILVIGIHRWASGLFMPRKGHTVRIRLNRFERAVRERDPQIVVSRHPEALKGAKTSLF